MRVGANKNIWHLAVESQVAGIRSTTAYCGYALAPDEFSFGIKYHTRYGVPINGILCKECANSPKLILKLLEVSGI